jgi:uncharacterized protein (TIGR00299 family) protein
MALGAFVDLGVKPEELKAELDKLGVPGWELNFHRDQRCGITGTSAVVETGELNRGHHEHGRSWREIRELIERSGLGAGAKGRGLAIFSRIAAAESQVHGTALDEVAFHEVGALDSIVDVVGTAVCLEILKPDRISCGEIELGGGTVLCEHGELPVPAPATLILCRGLPVRTGGFNKEMTTPTGAAILAASVDEFTAAGSFRELRTGYGIGKRKLDKPNVLRLSLRQSPGLSAGALPGGESAVIEELTLLETNIDDMSGEELGFFMEALFASGALDVTFTPCVMKKSRPGTIVSVLAAPRELDALRRTVFRCSAAAGFREIPLRRFSLKREETEVRGDFGTARKKELFFEGRPLRFKFEYEDRARLARERGISLEEAERIIHQQSPINNGAVNNNGVTGNDAAGKVHD